jgi:Toprim domain
MAGSSTARSTQQGALSLEAIDRLIGSLSGTTFRLVCPLCGPSQLTKTKRNKKTFRIWRETPGFASYNCLRCGSHGYACDGRASISVAELAALKAKAAAEAAAYKTKRLALARYLWSRRKPIEGTPAWTYLRRCRGISGPLPATLGYLPPWRDFPPAVIAAFGMARETAGGLVIDTDAIRAVHLIKLRPDGSDRLREDRDDEEAPKVTIGVDFNAAIELAPARHALIIAEGVEDALTAADLTGEGAWAAASAGRMPGLAVLVPIYVDRVTILVDDNTAGRVNSAKLAARLRRRGFEVLLGGAR